MRRDKIMTIIWNPHFFPDSLMELILGQSREQGSKKVMSRASSDSGLYYLVPRNVSSESPADIFYDALITVHVRLVHTEDSSPSALSAQTGSPLMEFSPKERPVDLLSYLIGQNFSTCAPASTNYSHNHSQHVGLS